MLARRSIERWRTTRTSPFDTNDDRVVNAFLHGSLGPDMGYFPGGDRVVSQTIHRYRTGETYRAMLENARTETQRAFAYGWLTHMLADVLIHPLVNQDARRRLRDGVPHVIEHVRVEAGLDVWFCARDPDLAGTRLRPAFDANGYRFLTDTLDAVPGMHIAPERLLKFERNVIRSAHAALHFVMSMARPLWWKDRTVQRAPILSAIGWHAATRLGPRSSMLRAYLTPHVPEPGLARQVEETFPIYDRLLEESVANGGAELPDYDLEKGELASDASGLRVA